MAEPTWNLGRFLGTLSFFRTLPFLGTVDWLFPTPPLALGLPRPAVALVAATPESEQRLYSRLNNLGLEVITHPQGWHQCPRLVAETAALDRLYPQIKDWASQEISRLLIDFRQPTESLRSLWGSLDDVVMGGVSSSGLGWSPDGAVFSGTVSTANSGGFASVRSRNLEPPLDLQGYVGLRLFVQGDGQRYKFILRTSSGWDSLAYIQSFATQAGVWQSVDLPFTDLIPTFRARSVPTAPAFQPSQVRSLQFMLSKFEVDRALNPAFRPGAFQLRIASLNGWIPAEQKQLLLVGTPSTQAEALGVRLRPWSLENPLPE
jgi:hypothetical protein